VADEPPWEWVDGDHVLARRFRWAAAACVGIGLVFVPLLLLDPAGMAANLSISGALWSGVTSVYLLLNFLVLYYVPKRFPVMDRLGLSPVGVRLESGFVKRGLPFSWSEVREVGPDWIAVSKGSALRQRYRLTTIQAERLSHFLGPSNNRPLPS